MGNTSLDRFDDIYAWVILGILAVLEIALVIYLKFKMDKSSIVLLGLSLIAALLRAHTGDIEPTASSIAISLMSPIAGNLFLATVMFFVFEMKNITNVLQSNTPIDNTQKRTALLKARILVYTTFFVLYTGPSVMLQVIM